MRSKEALAYEDCHEGDNRGVAEDEQDEEEELLERMDGGDAGMRVNTFRVSHHGCLLDRVQSGCPVSPSIRW